MTDDLTPLQGRLAFHMERVFRSTGAGIHAHQRFLQLAKGAALPKLIDSYTDAQCITGLRLVEAAAREKGLHLFRQVDTGWRELADKQRRAA